MTSNAKANLFTGVVVIIAAVIFISVFVGKTGDVEGKLTSPNAWTFSPDSCWSGQRRGFFGVGLDDSKHWGQVLAIDDVQRGQSIQLRPSQGKTITLTGKDCKELNVHVERSGTIVNDVRSLEGTLSMDCQVKGLGRVTGKLRFSGCH